MLSVEEGQRALGGIFEIVAPDKAGAGRAKKETHLRGTPIAVPIAPFATLAAPINPRHPYGPRARRGQGARRAPLRRTTAPPTPQQAPPGTPREFWPRAERWRRPRPHAGGAAPE